MSKKSANTVSLRLSEIMSLIARYDVTQADPHFDQRPDRENIFARLYRLINPQSRLNKCPDLPEIIGETLAMDPEGFNHIAMMLGGVILTQVPDYTSYTKGLARLEQIIPPSYHRETADLKLVNQKLSLWLRQDMARFNCHLYPIEVHRIPSASALLPLSAEAMLLN